MNLFLNAVDAAKTARELPEWYADLFEETTTAVWAFDKPREPLVTETQEVVAEMKLVLLRLY